MPIIMVGKLFENTWFTSFVDLCEIVSRYIFAKAKMRGLVEVDRVGGLARSGGGFGDRGGGFGGSIFIRKLFGRLMAFHYLCIVKKI